MKKIEAIVPPFKMKEIRQALNDANIGGMTIIEVTGRGRCEHLTEVYRGLEYDTSLRHRSKLEVVVADSDLDDVVDVICRSAHTGKPGDGKIFVSDIVEVIRISNQQRNESAV
jgi:nitrogen regulatory protein P-II 1